MSNTQQERLYNLLPAIYRIRDTEQGFPLKALFRILEGELEAIEGDIDALYDDWFIETCTEWVVPYIGDLLGVKGLHSFDTQVFSLRPYVANTIAYRRRKGTAAILEQLARDVTGWPARAVEFFQLLITTQNLNHLRNENLQSPELRNMNPLRTLATAFETSAHTVELRSVETEGGKYHVPHIGLFLWRLAAYRIRKGEARAVESPADGRYFFHPAGFSIPLFNEARTEKEITHLSEEHNVPGPLQRLPLYQELESLRQALAEGRPFQMRFFNTPPVFEIFLDDEETPIPPAQILICDLSDPPAPLPGGWRRPPQNKSYRRPDGSSVAMPIRVAVDPQLGRIAFPEGVIPGQVQVNYSYGFSGDVGSGPYSRQDATERWYDPRQRTITWQMGVTHDPETLAGAADPSLLRDNLSDAVLAWNNHAVANPGAFGVIVIMDNSSYDENLTGSRTPLLPAGCKLAIVAGDWPEMEDPEGLLPPQRLLGMFVPRERRPHIQGDISVRGIAPAADPNPGEFVLDGLLIEGNVTVLIGNLGELQINHCTLIPGRGGLHVNASVNPLLRNSRLRVQIYRSICEAVILPESVSYLGIDACLFDRNGDGDSLQAPGARAQLNAATVPGKSQFKWLEASNCIFADTLNVRQIQEGCLRFCFVSEDSRTPQRYRCQPDLALSRQAAESGLENPAQLPAAEAARIRSRIKPLFTSDRFAEPDYLQLSSECAVEIQTGAEDGAEMGAFNFLKQPQRRANLEHSLREYLRYGLKAGIFFVT